MALERIPINVESLLSASVFVSNYNKAIEELVFNSLDAESTSIAIRVSIEDSSIQILDNGSGITKNDLHLLGHRYMSSNIDTNCISNELKYGYRGLSLASIVEISQHVKITSRDSSSEDTYIKTFMYSKEQNICKTNARPSKGTTVEIKGFLYNLHIQRKSINPSLEMENIKTFIEHISLVSCSVSFSLRDDSRNEIVLKINKNRDIYQTLLSLYNISKDDVQELQVEKYQYKIRGFIEKRDNIVRKFHWIYINGRFVTQSKVHKIVSRHFKGLHNENIITKTRKNNFKAINDFVNKGMPSYFLFITCPKYDYDIIYAPEKTLIEFKKWIEMEKLIEKLLKFYYGELKVNLVPKQGICKDTKHNENDTDTRQQVKNIMQKILGNNLKNSKISQIPNGIKGNHVKRKRKNKTQDLKKLHAVFKNVTNCRNRIKTHNLLENCSNNFVAREPFHDNSMKNNLKISRNNKKTFTYKIKKSFLHGARKDQKIKKLSFSHDTVIRKYKEPISTAKIRCAMLADNVQRLLKENKKEVCHNRKHNKVALSSLTYLNDFIDQNTESVVAKNYTIKSPNSLSHAIENSVANNKDITFKTTYDLINPIHKSQLLGSHLNDLESSHRKLQSSLHINTYTRSDSSLPMLTYESHKYNAQLVSKRQAKRQFITTSSCNNFFLHKNYNFISSDNKKLKNKKDNTKKFNCQKYLKSHVNTIRNTRFIADQSYKIDLSSSYTTGLKYGSFHMNDNVSVSANNSQALLNSAYYKYNLNIESTYNIENLISLPATQAECDLQRTYTIHLSNNINHYEQTEFQQQEVSINNLNGTNNNKHNVSVSNTQNSKKTMSTIDPLNICETVYRCNELQSLEKEFEFSFVDKKDSLLNYEHNDKLSNDVIHVKEVSQYFLNDAGENSLPNNDAQNRIHDLLTNSEIRENAIGKTGTFSESHKEYTESNNINVDNRDNFELKRRFHLIPKGMSPEIVNNITETNVENQEEYYEDQIYRNFAKEIETCSEILEPRVHNINDFSTREIEKVTCKMKKDNTDLIFDAESLRHAKVLGQVDCKFIATKVTGKSAKSNKSSELLILFDQHAVDERIRLENNLRDYTDGHNWQSILLDPIVLKLSKDNILYLHNHKEKFARFGLHWTLKDGNISINSIPKAVLGQNPRNAEIIIKAVKCLISEQIEAVKSLKGNVSLYPKSIMDLVFSEACRYAIKFGDKLTKNECQNMLNTLAKCKVPFQCAHGRPVMAVIMDIPKSNHNYKVNRSAIMKYQMSIK